MIYFFRKYLNAPISIFLGVYMINLSIDAADMEGRFDQSVNEIESVFELVLEVFMDKGDVIPEHDEPDPEASSCFIGLDHIIPRGDFEFLALIDFTLEQKPEITQLNYSNPWLVLLSPPPKE